MTLQEKIDELWKKFDLNEYGFEEACNELAEWVRGGISEQVRIYLLDEEYDKEVLYEIIEGK